MPQVRRPNIGRRTRNARHVYNRRKRLRISQARCTTVPEESIPTTSSERQQTVPITYERLAFRYDTTVDYAGDKSVNFGTMSNSEALIYRVYNYLQSEYELLKSLNANNDCDLSPLSNILQRTTEAIGITPQMVSDVLNKKNLTKIHCSQIIKSEYNYYIDYSIRDGEEEEEETITAQNLEDYIPDLKLIAHNSKEFIIKEENIDEYNSDFKNEQHNTEEIRIKKENTELYSTDFNIEELNIEEFRIKEENTEDFGLTDDNIENKTEDDKRNKFTKDNWNQQINKALIMKCEVFDDPLSLLLLNIARTKRVIRRECHHDNTKKIRQVQEESSEDRHETNQHSVEDSCPLPEYFLEPQTETKSIQDIKSEAVDAVVKSEPIFDIAKMGTLEVNTVPH